MAPGWWASIVQDRGSAAPGQTTELRRLVHVWRRAWRALARLPSFPRQTNKVTLTQLSTLSLSPTLHLYDALPDPRQVPLSISVAASTTRLSARELSKLAAGGHDGSSLACARRKADQI